MGKIGSSILTFLLSVPLTAVTLVAIFGVPQSAQLSAAPDEEVVLRDPFHEGDQWASDSQLGQPAQFRQPSASRPQLHFGESQAGESRAPAFGSAQTSQAGNSLGNHAPEWGHPQNTPARDSYSAPADHSSNSTQMRNPFAQQDAVGHTPESFRQQGHAAPNPATGFPVSYGDATTLASNESTHLGESRHIPRETGIQLLSWQDAANRLADLGIENYHLESGANPGTFLFVCLYRPAATPSVTHRFEAEGNDPLVAVNQVITKVNDWIAGNYASQSYSNAAPRFTR